MTEIERKPLSWWCGLDRETLHREIDARLDKWQKQKMGLITNIGDRCREDWEPRRQKRNLRGPLA